MSSPFMIVTVRGICLLIDVVYVSFEINVLLQAAEKKENVHIMLDTFENTLSEIQNKYNQYSQT